MTDFDRYYELQAISTADSDLAMSALPSRDLEDALLAALAGMAVRSHRRQADLGVALRRAGLALTADLLEHALRRLEDDGCVDRVVPLADGGVLLSVTGHGIERISHTSRRHMVVSD